jgi:glyoxylase-like metal-dependent hydrolase (beta-lactamase superfamily II)
MSNVKSVGDDLFVIEQEMRPGWFFSVVVVLGKKNIGVIDTGFEDSPINLIFPMIEEKKRTLNEVNLVVNTHRDGDHVLGNGAFRENTKAKIAIHELEVEAVPDVDIELKDGMQVELGDRIFNVVHTPGHRPGSICLYDPEDRLLITGDSVCGAREDLIRMDKEIYIKSLKTLKKLDAKTMITSHPFKPPGKNLLFGKEVADFINASIQFAENL